MSWFIVIIPTDYKIMGIPNRSYKAINIAILTFPLSEEILWKYLEPNEPLFPGV